MFAFLVYVILSAAMANPPTAPSDLTQEFRARDQALLDAIAPGDVKL